MKHPRWRKKPPTERGIYDCRTDIGHGVIMILALEFIPETGEFCTRDDQRVAMTVLGWKPCARLARLNQGVAYVRADA